MSYEEFKSLLINKIKERVNKDIKVRTDKFTKNNNKSREGIIVELGDTVFPIIYLDELFDRYNESEDIEEILDQVMVLCVNGKTDVKDKVDILLRGQWEEIKDTIEVCVINKAWNKEKLEHLPYLEYLDLALVFRVVLDKSSQGNMSCLITNDLLARWNISKDELIEVALSRLDSSYYYIKSMLGVIKECLGSEEENVLGSLDEDIVGEVPLYVLSNSQRLNGATGIARVDIINKFACDLDSDLYILPSSIHELILLPATEECSVKDLRDMVKSVNKTEVDKEERLSDNVYYYSREARCLEIAA